VAIADDGYGAGPAKAPASAVSDDELLRLVGEERKRSVGFDNDAELISDREQALNYRKGVMPDVVAPPNRSKAVSTDVADAIATILPDLVEIFTGGEDVAAFIPTGPQDEVQAKQETDYVRQVVFNENDGWLTLYTMFDDALALKTGLVKYWWEDCEQVEELKGQTILGVHLASADGEIIAMAPSAEQPYPGGPDPAQPGMSALQAPPLYDVTVKRKGGRLCVKAIPPDDFTVSTDTTISLKDSPYCCFRARPRAQELLARGVDPAIVDQLPGYGVPNDQVNVARDTADESTLPGGGSGDMRQVETHEHYIRHFDGERMVLWRVETSADDAILIEREEVERVQIAAITPYIVTHRFYGRSVADLLVEIQKINTVITRGLLDSNYFALNQRYEVSDHAANEWTIGDLLRNEPGIPVRSKTGDAVRAIAAGGPGFDHLSSLEYFATKAEQRTGIVRAAQGLTPDTLHETARGALALLTQAQKRTRLIARVFAETGVKDLFLGCHAVLRKHSTQAQTRRLTGGWVEVDPTSWGERTDMTVEVGLGASGAQQESAALQGLMPVLEQVLTMQGGPHGPLLTLQNVYALLKRLIEKSGIKSADPFVTDPSTAPQGPPGAPGAPGAPPPPNPDLIKAQGQLQLEHAKAAASAQLEQSKAATQAQAAQQQAQIQAQTERYKADLDAQIRREELAQNMQLKREQMTAELNLQRELNMASQLTGQANLASQVHPGGEPG
jgi:hypothetical protein